MRRSTAVTRDHLPLKLYNVMWDDERWKSGSKVFCQFTVLRLLLHVNLLLFLGGLSDTVVEGSLHTERDKATALSLMQPEQRAVRYVTTPESSITQSIHSYFTAEISGVGAPSVHPHTSENPCWCVGGVLT